MESRQTCVSQVQGAMWPKSLETAVPPKESAIRSHIKLTGLLIIFVIQITPCNNNSSNHIDIAVLHVLFFSRGF